MTSLPALPTFAVPGGRGARLALLVSILLTAAVLVPLGAGPAQAATTPATPLFPSTIDAYARYEAESSCQPTAKPGATALAALLSRTYGSGIGTNVSRSCTASDSGHEEGRAVDWMAGVRDATERAQAQAFLDWLLATDKYGNKHANARRLGVMYLIWNSRKLYLWDTAAGWTEYADCLRTRTSVADDTYCHRDHVHISLSWAGAREQTTWWTLAGQSRPSCPAVGAVTAAAPAATETRYVPLAQPARLLDTRTGAGTVAGGCWLAPGGQVDLQVTGRGGVPSSGVLSAVLNVTATGVRTSTWVAAYPTGTTFSGTSSVNVDKGGNRAALVVVPVGSGGRVSLRNGPGATDLVVDVVGYQTAATSTAAAPYAALETSRRLLDARVPAGTPVRVATQLPAGATGAVVNVTIDRHDHGTYVVAAPTVTGTPTTSTVNAAAGETVANRAYVTLVDGGFDVWSLQAGRVVVDLVGWFGAPGSAGLDYVATTPRRVMDSRRQLGVDRLVSGDVSDLDLGGTAGVPADARAVVMTLTGVGSSSPSFVTAWAGGAAPPGTSDLNLGGPAPTANLVVVPLAEARSMALATHSGATDVVGDLLGWYR